MPHETQNEEPENLRAVVVKLCELQMATMRQVAAVEAKVAAMGLVSAMVSTGYEFAEGELGQTLSIGFTRARRKYVEQVNDFLLNNRYIAEPPPDDPRWDEPASGPGAPFRHLPENQ